MILYILVIALFVMTALARMADAENVMLRRQVERMRSSIETPRGAQVAPPAEGG